MRRDRVTLLKEATDRRVRSMTTKCRTACRTNCCRLKSETNLALMLCLVFYLYICLGGALFLLLEGQGEIQSVKVNEKEERFFRNYSFTRVQQIAMLDFCDYKNELERRKKPYHENLWNFMEATDFAYQIITGQGTGQTTRLLRTLGGKISYIFFVFLGTPLTVLTLRATGQRLNILVYATIRFINVNIFKRQLTSNIHIKALFFNISLFIILLLIGMTVYSRTQGWGLVDSMFYTVSIAFTNSNSREKVINKDIEINSDEDKFLRILFNFYTFIIYTVLSSLTWSAHHFTRHMRFKAQNQQQANAGNRCPWVEVTRSHTASPSKSTRERETDRESVC